ncbi:MAG: hypothetical protein ACI8ZO_000215 [Flavobacteriales bacterium]|jgi:hypothetical protein
MKNKKIGLLVIAVVLLFGGTHAQVRKFSNEFLNIGVGANALGQSNAVVATVDDLSASYWNPAGLNSIGTQTQIGVQHAEYFASIAKYDYFGFAKRIDPTSAIGISLIRFGVDDILDTSELLDNQGNVDYDRINKFNAADYALLLSYARNNIVKDLDLGVTTKLIYRNIGDFASAVGFGFDLGAQYQLKDWRFGAVVKDVTGTFNAWQVNTERLSAVFDSTGNEAPTEGLELTLPSLVTGVSRAFSLSENLRLKGEFNFRTYFDGERNEILSLGFASVDPSLGFQLGYKSWAFLRFGFGNFQKDRSFEGDKIGFQPNAGVGVVYNNFYLDYAFTDIGDQSVALYSHVFSLKYQLALSK